MSKTIRAKFRCDSIKKTIASRDAQNNPIFNQSVHLYPVTSADGKGNEQWSKWTPQGNLEMTINNPEAQIFEPGKDYYLDICEVTPE